MNRRGIAWLIIALALLLALSEAVKADVTVTQKVSTSMMGGLFSSGGTMTTTISGDKQKTESEMKMDMGFMSGPSMKETSIIRLDKGVSWSIDHDKKRYTEVDLAHFQDQMESASRAQQGGTEGEMPNYDDYEMEPPEITVERSGKKEKIAGYPCEEVILKMVMKGKDKKTGDTGSFIVTDYMWVTKDCPGYEEFLAFGTKSAETMGVGLMASGSMAQMGTMGIDTKELADKMKEIDGFPMKQTMLLNISGEITSGGMTAEEQADQQKAMKDAKEKLKDLGGLGGLFGKKKDDKAEEPKMTQTDDDSMSLSGTVMQMVIEVEDISTKGVKGTEFEVPEGYKKTN